MAWRLQYFQRKVAESDDVAMFEQSSYRWLFFLDIHAKEGRCTFPKMFYQILVFSTDFHLQTILVVNEGIAEIVV